jgi:hypothetical protein
VSVSFVVAAAPEAEPTVYDCCVDEEVACGRCDEDRKVRFVDRQGEFNVANATARAMFGALDLDVDLCGAMPVADMPDLRRRILRALAGSPAVIDAQTSPAEVGLGARGARWIDCGISRERLEARLHTLDELARIAQRYDGDLTWG